VPQLRWGGPRYRSARAGGVSSPIKRSSMKKTIRKFISVLPWVAASTASASTPTSQADEDAFWQQVYDSRSAYYEKYIGQFPDDILKMGNMAGWRPICVERGQNR